MRRRRRRRRIKEEEGKDIAERTLAIMGVMAISGFACAPSTAAAIEGAWIEGRDKVALLRWRWR